MYQENCARDNGKMITWPMMCDFLKQGRYLILASLLAGLTVAAVFLACSSLRYKATALISIAIVAEPETGGLLSAEPPLQMIERLRYSSSYPADFLRQCSVMSASSPQIDERSLMALSVMAASAETAEACIKRGVKMIYDTQEKFVVSARATMDAAIRAGQDQLRAKWGVAGDKASHAQEIAALEKHLAQLQAATSRFSSVRLVAYEALPQPVYPRKTPTMLLGLLSGLLLGLLAAGIRNIFR